MLACVLFYMIVRSIAELFASFLLISWCIWYIFWNINQYSLKFLLFSLLCMRRDNFIIPFLDVVVFSSEFCSSSFTRLITLRAHKIYGFGVISLTIFLLPNQWRPYCSSVETLFVSSISPFIPSTYTVVTMCYSSSLRR